MVRLASRVDESMTPCHQHYPGPATLTPLPGLASTLLRKVFTLRRLATLANVMWRLQRRLKNARKLYLSKSVNTHINVHFILVKIP